MKIMSTYGKPAIEGGEPTIKEPLPKWPWFTEDIIRAAMEPLRTGEVNYWTGELGRKFEKEWANWNGSKYGVLTSSGTSALHTAVAALGIGPGDEVIVPSYTFIATAFCVLQAGAIPVFADVRRNDHCIDPKSIEEKITDRTKAIIPVHLYGNVCEMNEIMRIARKNDLFVIEDAAEAHGAMYKGNKVGTIGNAGCFSFCQNKTFTTGGEGGAVITDDEELYWQCMSFRDHGFDAKKRLSLLELEGTLHYIHVRVGYNYRMTEMQAAIGLAEMKRLDNWNLPRRRRNGEILIKELREVPQVLYLPVHNSEKVNGFYVFPIVVDIDNMKIDKNKLIEALVAEGVPAWRSFWPQSYTERAFLEHNGFGRVKFPFRSKEYTNPESVRYDKVYCPNAVWLEKRTFIVHCYPTLEEEHMRLIADGIKKVLSYYAK